MSAATFSFHPAAIEEAIFAARWYRERSPLAATRFVAELNQTIDRILEAPHHWPRSAHDTRTQASLFSLLGDLSRSGRIRPGLGRGPRPSPAWLLEKWILSVRAPFPNLLRQLLAPTLEIVPLEKPRTV